MPIYENRLVNFNFGDFFMRSIVYLISLLMVLSTSANAGFWSSVAGGVVANSLTGSGNHGSHNVNAKSDEKKIQQVLTKLGYYNGKIDGKLNSFETRAGIEEFQKHYFAEPTGTLTEQEKQDFFYIHDLFKNYKQEYKNPGIKDSQKLLKLYQAFDKIEDKIRNNNASFVQKMKLKLNKPEYLSSKLKKDIAQRRIALEKIKKYEDKWAKKGTFADYKTKLIWQDNIDAIKIKKPWIINENYSRNTTGDTATTYCKKLILADEYDWRLPTKDELEKLYYSKNKLVNLASADYWTSTTKSGYGYSHLYAWTIDFNNNHYSDTHGKLTKQHVRCVRKDLGPINSTSIKKFTTKELFKIGINKRHRSLVLQELETRDLDIKSWYIVIKTYEVQKNLQKAHKLYLTKILPKSNDKKYLNSYLWNSHLLKEYSKNYETLINSMIEQKPKLVEWDTIAWVYKDNGNKKKAIEIYKTKILAKSNDKKWKQYFKEIQK